MKQKIMIQTEDGKELDLQEVIKDAASESIKEMELPMEGGKFSLKGMNFEVKNESQLKGEKIEEAANFIKSIILPVGKHAQFGVKAIDATTGSFGNTVPVTLAEEILIKKQKFSVLRGRAFQFELAGKFDLPIEGTGVTGYWVGENVAITESNPTAPKVSLDDYYLAAMVKVSWKLLQTSSQNIVSFVTTLAAKALAETEETAFIAGDGSSKPTGLRQASITQTVAQAGGSFAYTDLTGLYFLLPKKYRQNAVFITSAKGARLIHELKDSQNRPIFQPGMPLDVVLNKPLLESEDIPANLGAGTNETEMFFGDPFYYWIKDGQGLEMATQDVIENLQTKVVVYQAVDGKVVLVDAFAKLTAIK